MNKPFRGNKLIILMDITYLGHSSFRIKGKTATIVTDPYDPEMVGLKFPKVSADIVTVSHNHGDHNFTQNVSDVKKVVSAPGEYEIMGVSIFGITSYHDEKKGEERGKNTIYAIEMDGLRIVHLGDLGHVLSESMVEDLGSIDILMIPVGGYYTIGAEKASKVTRDTEAAIVIPMHYKSLGLNPDLARKLSSVEDFLTESGLSVERMDKLSVKKSDIPDEGQKIVVLEKK
jgi:L-ascorbate metabolism protein UlaG (beta-lactamase superfamily)